ncbi:MAG: hydrolase [Christensenellales bacterium]|jgi:hypothetical protein
MKDYKNQFIEIYNNNIKREGAKELLDWLLSTDFFRAPASSKFHSNHEGGLCKHSINVYNRFKQNIENEFGKNQTILSEESIAICGLLHDVCKAEFYKLEMRNVKVDGIWVQKPYYSVEEKLPFGHGEKSVYIINGFLRLTREEAMIINWHMGGFDARVLGGSNALSNAYYKYPTAVIFHISDIQATYLDEEVENN